MTETQQVIYSMVRVGRIHPPNRQVLRESRSASSTALRSGCSA